MDKDYLKRLEEVAKMAKYDDYDLDSLINRSGSAVNDTIDYRDLLENASAREYLKNTGVSIPDIKTANKDQIEKFIRDMINENYGTDFGTSLNFQNLGKNEGIFDPKLNKITLNENLLKKTPEEIAAAAFHEYGHKFDNSKGLNKSIEINEFDPIKKKAMKDIGAEASKSTRNIPLEDLGEIIQTGHHATHPERLKSFGRSALENLVKGKVFRSLALPAAVGAGVALSSGDAQAGLEGAAESILPIGTDPTTSGSAKGSPEYKLESNQPLTSEDMDTLNYNDNQRSQEIDRQLRNNSVFKDEVKNAPNKLNMLNKLKGLNLG